MQKQILPPHSTLAFFLPMSCWGFSSGCLFFSYYFSNCYLFLWDPGSICFCFSLFVVFFSHFLKHVCDLASSLKTHTHTNTHTQAQARHMSTDCLLSLCLFSLLSGFSPSAFPIHHYSAPHLHHSYRLEYHKFIVSFPGKIFLKSISPVIYK